MQGSAKRDTEWDTIWAIAEAEGGKRKILEFVQGLEDEAKIV